MVQDLEQGCMVVVEVEVGNRMMECNYEGDGKDKQELCMGDGKKQKSLRQKEKCGIEIRVPKFDELVGDLEENFDVEKKKSC